MDSERITIIVEVNTDPVPGWGNDPNDYVEMLQIAMDARIPHYNPEVRLLGEDEYIGGPVETKEPPSQGHIRAATRDR